MNIDRAATTLAVSLGWEPDGKRRPGRPKQTWRKVILKLMKTAGISSWNEAAKLALDRESWKQKGDLLCLQLRATRLSETLVKPSSNTLVIRYDNGYQ